MGRAAGFILTSRCGSRNRHRPPEAGRWLNQDELEQALNAWWTRKDLPPSDPASSGYCDPMGSGVVHTGEMADRAVPIERLTPDHISSIVVLSLPAAQKTFVWIIPAR